MRHVAILILAIFLVSSIYAPASASTVTVTVTAQQVHADFALSLTQNVTALPIMTTGVNSSSGSNISAAFTQALRNVDVSASPSDLEVALTSVKGTLNMTCSMNVGGITKQNGDILTANMTWLPFDVTSDLRAQNFSFNTIGRKYLRAVVAFYANASRYVGLPNATITGVSFFVNGTSVGPPAAENYVGNFTALNFNTINPDVGQWNRTYTVNNDTTTWRYFPPQLLDLGMLIQRKNVTTDYVASYGYDVSISVSGVGRAQGVTLIVSVGSGETEWVMAAITVLAVISAIGLQMSIRNRSKKLVRFQKKYS